MEPCIVCQSNPEQSTVESVIVIDGVALCKPHRDELEAHGLEYKQVDLAFDPDGSNINCICPPWVREARVRGEKKPHDLRCPRHAAQPLDSSTVAPVYVAALDQTVDAKEMVNHPSHYGGGDNPYEVIKVLTAWGLDEDAHLWNSVKYISRAGKKDPDKEIEDLEKAAFYLQYAIAQRKERRKAQR